MAGLDDDQRLCFAVLAICDALEQRDDTKARESLDKARKHAHAILRRYKGASERHAPEYCLCQPDRRDGCGCITTCICDTEPLERKDQ